VLPDPALLAKWQAAGDMRPEVGHRFSLNTPPGKKGFEGMGAGWPIC